MKLIFTNMIIIFPSQRHKVVHNFLHPIEVKSKTEPRKQLKLF